MPIRRESLIIRALAVLDEAIEQCAPAPIVPGTGVRFALAYLYSLSAREPELFAEFLQLCQDRFEHAYSEDQRSYLRTTYLRTTWRGIARSVGAPETVAFDLRVAEQWRRKPEDG